MVDNVFVSKGVTEINKKYCMKVKKIGYKK